MKYYTHVVKQTCIYTLTYIFFQKVLDSKEYLEYFLMYTFPLFILYTYILLLDGYLSEFAHAIFTLTQMYVLVLCVVCVHMHTTATKIMLFACNL